MTTVVLVDDDGLMRAGLAELLGADPTIAILGEAGTGREAVERVVELAPEVVLMDVRMPDIDGIAATAELARVAPLSKVVILTTFDQDDYLFEALRAGASGFLLKRCRPEELIAAVHVVAAGDALLSPTVTRRVIDRMAQPGPAVVGNPSLLRSLTARERDVLLVLGRGLSNREIATRLYIEESTVRTHVKRILMKLDLRDRIQAVIYVYENGITRPGEAAGPAPRSP